MKYDAPIICRALSASAGKAETMSVTVLLIDDSKFMRRANELAVTKSGYGVLTAADGEEGLRVAHDKVPDVIVLDMMLPKISGPQLLHALKQDPRTAGIPVIVLSSLPQSNEAKLKSEGAAAYFEKAKLGIESGSNGLVRAIQDVLKKDKLVGEVH
jgi:two-component system cell cycle response regulator DivK